MGGSLFEALFGCTHSRTTFPLTPLPHSRKIEVLPSEPRTYVACLECGKELPYDWQTMRRIKVRERRSCKWRLCPTEGSCADLTPGQSLHLLAKSQLEKNIESSLPQPLQSGDWPVKEPATF